MLKKITKTIRWMVALFFASTILVVIIYRFIPVYITPLMIIRAVENISEGRSPRYHHTWVSADMISSNLPVAVMASEDQRFLEHHGFDADAIEAATKYNKTHEGKTRGASTITQQVAKNVFLWPGRSWVRKGFEAYFTMLIELFWSKERILEIYLNSIEMGNNIYGAEAVAQTNFGKSASELTQYDCALIAATLPNPRRFSSASPSPYIVKRQKQILRQMKYIRGIVKKRELKLHKEKKEE